MKQVGDIGEFGLIERLTKMLPQPADVLVGAGDDAAVFKLSSGQIVVGTCDMFVEYVHFDLSTCEPSQVGWRAMTASLSDIAAMGCKPRFAMVSLGVPAETSTAVVEQIYDGLVKTAARHAAAIVGGDTVRSPERIVIDVSLMGEPAGLRYLTRSGASSGDAIVVTGHPGQSVAGLEILFSGTKLRGDGLEELVRAHLEPRARVEQGLFLAQNDRVSAAIDLSDGLAQDLGHICEMSQVGAVIDLDKLPISHHLAEYCGGNSKDAARLCLSGGEDYELLFTVREAGLEPFIAEWRGRFELPATMIGRMTSKFEGVRLRDGDEFMPADAPGYDHFREAGS
jgi:thiamine-monophosphate kinase